jgi:hypothetical protein
MRRNNRRQAKAKKICSRGEAGAQIRIRTMQKSLEMVPEKGVEPSRPCGQRILSPPRLPFRHSGVSFKNSMNARVSSTAVAWRRAVVARQKLSQARAGVG